MHSHVCLIAQDYIKKFRFKVLKKYDFLCYHCCFVDALIWGQGQKKGSILVLAQKDSLEPKATIGKPHSASFSM